MRFHFLIAVCGLSILSSQTTDPNKSGFPHDMIWFNAPENPPPGVEPLRWDLLTTCPVEDFQAAVEKLRWYAGRWGIEVFHRVLKSGCHFNSGWECRAARRFPDPVGFKNEATGFR